MFFAPLTLLFILIFSVPPIHPFLASKTRSEQPDRNHQALHIGAMDRSEMPAVKTVVMGAENEDLAGRHDATATSYPQRSTMSISGS